MSEPVQIFRRRPLTPPNGAEPGVAFPPPDRMGTAVQPSLEEVVAEDSASEEFTSEELASYAGESAETEVADLPAPVRKGPKPPLDPAKVMQARDLRAQGKTHKEIAETIGASPLTVAKYTADVEIPEHLRPKRGRQPGSGSAAAAPKPVLVVKPAPRAKASKPAAATAGPSAEELGIDPTLTGLAKARAVKAAKRAAELTAGREGPTTTAPRKPRKPIARAATTKSVATVQVTIAPSGAAGLVVTLIRSGKLTVEDALAHVPAEELVRAALSA